MRFAFLQEPPFCFTDASGRVDGCDTKLASKICQMLDLRDFSPVEAEFAELLPGVADGRWDMTTGLFVSDERKRLADFTRPIWSLPDGLMVTGDNPSELKGYRSLARHPSAILAVIADQIQHQTALQNGVPSERIRIFATQARAAEAVAKGTVQPSPWRIEVTLPGDPMRGSTWSMFPHPRSSPPLAPSRWQRAMPRYAKKWIGA